MNTQKFGIEIEMTGLTRAAAARVVASYFNTTSSYYGGGYDEYRVADDAGRTWKLMRDSSIEIAGGEQVELVSPICEYADIKTVQELIRKLKAAGAKTNSSCGIHVHINAKPHTVKTLTNLVNIMTSKEDLLYTALGIGARADRWCKKVDEEFLKRLKNAKPKTLMQLQALWYNGHDGSNDHYDSTRYHGLNLHAVFSKGTVEFRLFNGTLHAGKIKTYIQLCMAISHQALTQKSASSVKTITTNEKYTFRTWLLRLGLIGKEYETARYHLLANLAGDTAFRYGRAA